VKGSVLLKKEFSLSQLTTFQIGGKAEYFIAVSTADEVREALFWAEENGVDWVVIGKGSNLLFDDLGFDGLVILNKIDHLLFQEEGMIEVGAGVPLPYLATQTVKKKLCGLEFAIGIPGSVGGGIWMNAGAGPFSLSDHLISIDFITPEGQRLTFSKSELTFTYRFSSFQKKRGIIVGATFQLLNQGETSLQQILNERLEKQPFRQKTCGCIFKNPDSTLSAGKIIDHLGLKGKQIGGARISLLHGNFIENCGGATSQDVLDLISYIEEIVFLKVGVRLERECVYIPHSKKGGSHG